LSKEPEGIVDIAKFEEVAAWSEVLPEMVTAPAKVEVTDVEVAKSAPTDGVDVPETRVPSKAKSDEFERVEAFVPPFATGSTPVTCDVSDIWPASVEKLRQEFPIA